MHLDGMSNESLESLSRASRLELGLSRWSSWESERTGFGRLFRRRAHYPDILPLRVASDHYVSPLVALRPNEVRSGQSVYLTWNARKAGILRDHGVNAHFVRHPWLDGPKAWFEQPQNASGTLVFWPHSHQTLTQDFDEGAFLAELHSLGPTYQPFSIMLSSHDIGVGLHKRLRRYNLPIYTAGDLLSQNFPSRFYNILRTHRFAVGPHVSTQTYVCLQMGIPYRVVGRSSFQYRRLLADGSVGEVYDEFSEDFPDPLDLEAINQFYDRLEGEILSVPHDLRSHASDLMGMKSPQSDKEFARLIWRALFARPPEPA